MHLHAGASKFLKDTAMKLNRAYSIIEVKGLDDGERIIEGIASTPVAVRMDDIVEPMGAKFALPMPLLWQHRSSEPVGHVESAQVTDKGISFRARIAKIEEPGELKNLVDKAYQAVKSRLVRAVSIGFRSLKSEDIKDDKKGFWGGTRFKEWEWLELSLVTIPANQDATINVVRSIDAELLTASGQPEQQSTAAPAGVTAKPKPVVKAKEAKRMAKKTLAETISAFEATRAAKAAQRDEIMEKSAETQETFDAAQTEQYDGLVGEIKAIDEHLVRLRDLEESNKRKAAPIKAETPEDASKSRSSTHDVRVSVRHREVEPW